MEFQDLLLRIAIVSFLSIFDLHFGDKPKLWDVSLARANRMVKYVQVTFVRSNIAKSNANKVDADKQRRVKLFNEGSKVMVFLRKENFPDHFGFHLEDEVEDENSSFLYGDEDTVEELVEKYMERLDHDKTTRGDLTVRIVVFQSGGQGFESDKEKIKPLIAAEVYLR
ncbi:hypothetical protein Tco_0999945 [Tanacetum coccineum]